MELGFVSLRRLKRACQFATRFTLDELERVIAMQLVQKLQAELKGEQKGSGDRGQESEQPEQQISAEQHRPETADDKARGSETRPEEHESSGTPVPKASA